MSFESYLAPQNNLKKSQKKIVCLDATLAETLYDLNVEEFIVGVTQNCENPPHFLHTKALVGTSENINFEKIKELNPDIIFYNPSIYNKKTITLLKPIAPLYAIEIKSLEKAASFISDLGLFLNRRTEANLLNRKIAQKQNDFTTFLKTVPVKKVAFFVNNNPWTVVANHTYIHQILELNKFENIYQNLEGFSEINPKRIRHDGDPEVLLFSTTSFPFKDEHAFEISEYTNRSSAVFIDGNLFNSYGSQFLRALSYFKTLRLRLQNGASF